MTYSGTIKLGPAVDLAALPAHLATCLRRAKANAIEVSNTSVSYRAGLFRLVSNWNVLSQFGSGEITVDPAARIVRYRLRYRELVALATLMIAIAAVVPVAVPDFPALPPALYFGGWALLVGGNLLIGISNMRWFLRNAVAGAPTARVGPEPDPKAW